VLVEDLTAERILRWRNQHASWPKRVHTKAHAVRPATKETPDGDDTRRKRRATANRILTILKALLNHAFSRTAGSHPTRPWRRVKPFGKVDEAVVWGRSHQQRPLEEPSKKAEVSPAVTFHILRHTHGSHLAMRGVPMAMIAKQLGHADTRMTEKHYAHLAPNYVADTIRANLPTLGVARPTASTDKVVALRTSEA